MIDTDKYEGHTPAPWELITNYSEENWDNKWVGSVHLFTTLGISFDVVGVNETDVQLMADAPLLLAEVQRLREVAYLRICLIGERDKEIGRLREALVTVQRSLIWDEEDRTMDGDPITLEALVAQVEQVRSDITEMIE